MSMTKQEWAVEMSAATKRVQYLEFIKPRCENCHHFDEVGWCIKFEADPPAEILAAGCDSWVFDNVPF